MALAADSSSFRKNEWPLWSALLLTQISALLNLALFPQVQVFVTPLVALAILTLIGVMFSRRILLTLIVISILTSESLFIEAGAVVIRGIDLLLVYVLAFTTIKWLVQPADTTEVLPIFRFALSLLILTALSSLLGTISFENSLIELLQIVELIVTAYLFYNLIKNESDIKLVLGVIFVWGTLDAIWILFQYKTGQLHGRHIGIFNTFAFELSYGVALAVAYFHMIKRTWLKYFSIFCGILQISAIYLSKGRGMLITAIVMAFVCNVLFARTHRRVLPFLYVTTIILAACLFSLLALPQEVQTRYTSIVAGGEMRDLRLIIWAVALKVWRKFPLFGVGFGNAEIALAKFAPKPFGIALTALTGVKTPHNEFLSFAVQGGIIGFVAGIIFYSSLFRQSLLIYLKSRSRLNEYSIILFSFIIGLIIFNLANDTLLAGKGMLVMLFISLIARLYTLSMTQRTPNHI